MNSEYSKKIARSRVSSLVVFGLTIWGVITVGCGYPEVSPKTYEFAKALYSATNLKQSDRVDEVETLIEAAISKGEISRREANYLREIIELSRSGEWEEAQKMTRRLMEDQVNSRV